MSEIRTEAGKALLTEAENTGGEVFNSREWWVEAISAIEFEAVEQEADTICADVTCEQHAHGDDWHRHRSGTKCPLSGIYQRDDGVEAVIARGHRFPPQGPWTLVRGVRSKKDAA